MTKKERKQISEAIRTMFMLYTDSKSPQDRHNGLVYHQGVNDCLEALKLKGVIKNYNLAEQSFEF